MSISQLRRPRSMSADLAAKLEQQIHTMEPGDRLPPERELGESLGASRTTVREALWLLEQRRLIERVPGRGTTVLKPPQGVDFRLERLTRDDQAHAATQLRDSAELRFLVEPAIAEAAARRATGADIASLEAALAQAHTGIDAAESLRLDVLFHHRVAVATGNPYLVSVCEATAALVAPVRGRSHASAAGRSASFQGHQAILTAIASRDPEAARQAMAAHLSEVTEQFVDLLDESAAPGEQK